MRLTREKVAEMWWRDLNRMEARPRENLRLQWKTVKVKCGEL